MENELLKKIRKIEIKTKSLSHQIFAGEYHSAFKGRGMAFSEVREYQFGDDVRNMDWNVTARLRSPYIKIFEEEFVDSPELETILEDMSIYWNDDLAYALTYVCRTLDSLAKGERWSLMPLYQSDMLKNEGMDSDKLFVHKLLRSSYAGYGKYSEMVMELVSNWDKERIVSTDMVLIVMGMAEILNFPEIPVKVSINEYVEISKFYGTPKSRIFVNGLLDRLVAKINEDGLINKSGKGLK